MVAKTNKCT